MWPIVNARPSVRTSAWTASLSMIALLSGCTVPVSPSPTPPPAVSSAPGSPAISPSANATNQDAAPIGVDPTVVSDVRALCAPGAGKTVEELPDVTIPAVTWAGVSVPEQRIVGATVPAVDIPTVDIPTTIGEAGCVVTYEAPAGCLPKVEISAAWIPGITIDGLSFDDSHGKTTRVDGTQVAAVVVKGATAAQQCQVGQKSGNAPAVARPAIARVALARPAAARAGASRSAENIDGQVVAAVAFPSLYVAPVYLPAHYVAAGYLPSRQLTKDVTAVGDDTTVAYEASESVLFEYNKAALLPAAAQTLDAILADAAAKGFAGTVRVEGHTDNTGEDAANQRLSEARARAVADYLTAHGVAAGRLTVIGRGETAPAYPNDTDDGRAKNRRVVIEFRHA